MIDKENNFIFIHIPKNAGVSMNRAMKINNPAARMCINMHAPWDVIKSNSPHLFDTAFKFTFVRNPWDRLYSMYKFNIGRREEELTFDEWVLEDNFTVASNMQEPKVAINKKSQCDWICNNYGEVMVDFIGRFETIDKDWKTVTEKCNIKAPLLKTNASNGIHLNYRDAYNNKTEAFVREYFKKDIEMFDYKF